MTELSSCPFCDSDMLTVIGDSFRARAVECRACGARGPCMKTEKSARKAWNQWLSRLQVKANDHE